MARQLRIEFEGAFYHITARGNRRENIFWRNRDREKFQEILKRTKDRYGYLLHAYVLMDNHYHLLIETPHANIKQTMQNINTSYTVYANRRYGRSGHLFQGRYKSFIVDKESYLVELSRYIHLNPVKAGIADNPGKYKWSSYREYFNGKVKQPIADTDDTLCLFSKERKEAIKKYGDFIYSGMTKGSPLEKAVGSILGNETFMERVFGYLQGSPDRTEIPDIKKIESKHRVRDIVKTVADYYGLTADRIVNRRRATARQRKAAIYLVKTLSGGKNGEVGKVFGVSTQAVTNVVGELEQMKDKDKKLNKEIISIKRNLRC